MDRLALAAAALLLALPRPAHGLEAETETLLRALEEVRFVRSTSLSPDGRRLAWVVEEPAEGGWPVPVVWWTELDGALTDSGPAAEPRRLAVGSHPRWSPDGERLATLTRGEGGRRVALWSMSGEAGPGGGGEPERVVALPGPAAEMAWSPDGRRLAVVVNRFRPGEGPRPEHLPGSWQELFLVDPSSGGAVPVPVRVPLPDGVSAAVEGSTSGGSLSWAPDSRRLVLAGVPSGSAGGAAGPLFTDVYLVEGLPEAPAVRALVARPGRTTLSSGVRSPAPRTLPPRSPRSSTRSPERPRSFLKPYSPKSPCR
jgi:dipeptidyl aminopeptidase/acylaminoacyl peptidase